MTAVDDNRADLLVYTKKKTNINSMIRDVEQEREHLLRSNQALFRSDHQSQQLGGNSYCETKAKGVMLNDDEDLFKNSVIINNPYSKGSYINGQQSTV